MKTYKISSYLRLVTDSETGLVWAYHSLFGNPVIINNEGLRFLNLFRDPIDELSIAQACDENPQEAMRDFLMSYFIVESGCDEKAIVRHQHHLHMINVETGVVADRMGLAISDACNFGCAHCIHFQPEGEKHVRLQIYQKPHRELLMTFETAQRCVDHVVALMRKNNSNLCRIHFGNAEPLINWGVIKQVLEYCDSLDGLKFEYSINTNLSLLTLEIANILKKYRVGIATSLDGLEKANDAIRVDMGGKGTFQLIKSKMDLLDGIAYPLDGFSITVTSKNFELVDTDIIDFAVERGMKSIAFDYDLIGLSSIPVGVRVEKLIRLKRYANQLGLEFFGTWDTVFRNLTSVSLLRHAHAFCAAVQGKSLEFNVDGSMKLCGHTTTDVGRIDRFAENFKSGSGLLKIVSDRFPGTDDYCTGCEIEGACGGQCHVTREVVQRSVPSEREQLFSDMCDFYRAITRELAREEMRMVDVPQKGGDEYGENQNQGNQDCDAKASDGE